VPTVRLSWAADHLSLGRDILERKKAEETLRASERRFRNLSWSPFLLNTIPESLVLLSCDFKVLWANNGFWLSISQGIMGLQGHTEDLKVPPRNSPGIA